MSSLFDINNRAPVSVHITYRSITMATPTDISDVTTAYSSLIGKTFAGTYKESKNMGLTTDGSGSTRRLVISIDEANVDSAMIETLQEIRDLYEGIIWKGFVWHDKYDRYTLYIGESDIDANLTEGMSYKFEIIGVKDFGHDMTWKEPQKYVWKRGMNISLRRMQS